jgi:hypothetical protein
MVLAFGSVSGPPPSVQFQLPEPEASLLFSPALPCLSLSRAAEIQKIQLFFSFSTVQKSIVVLRASFEDIICREKLRGLGEWIFAARATRSLVF